MTTHFRACNLCEAMCGIRVEVDGDQVTAIRPDEEDPFSRGYMCPKAVALKDLHEDPDRLRHPMRRTATGWEKLGWDEALDFAVEGLSRVQAAHGHDAVGVYLGNPTVHNTGALLFGPMFLRALRTKNRYSATSVDQLPHMLTAFWMFGHQFVLPIPDLDRTQLFLIVGANPLASNGSLMTAPGMRRPIADIRARGGRVVVVDPRRTETAERADEHIFVRPGTDALLLASLLHVILDDEKAARLGAVAGFTDGVEVLKAAIAEATPERVAPHTGVGADTIRRLAADFAASPAAVAYGRVGTSTQAFGTVCQWLINALNIVTGNLDRAGGAMFPKPALDPRLMPKGFGLSRGSFGRWKSRVRGLPEFGGELPVVTLAEDILTDGKDRIRAMVTIAGNPVLSNPNGARTDEAYASLDFAVSIDPYLNETSRHAHIILPPPSPLERSHFDVVFHLLAVRETVRYAPAVFALGPDARHDWQILHGLTTRIEDRRYGHDLRKNWRRKLKDQALARFGPEGLLDAGLRLGRRGFRRWPPRMGLTLKEVERHPHGIDLGPLTPSLPDLIGHKDRRIQLAPAPLLADLPRLWAAFPSTVASPPSLVLIGRRHLRDNNSWMHNVPQLMRGKARCTLMVHPEDAQRLGLQQDGQARVRSRVGEVRVPVHITDEIMPGVVSLPHGYGHGRGRSKLAVAEAHAGVSINDLTDELFIDPLSGNAAFCGVPVDVTAVS